MRLPWIIDGEPPTNFAQKRDRPFEIKQSDVRRTAIEDGQLSKMKFTKTKGKKS